MLVPPWLIAILALRLPAEYVAVDSTTEHIAPRIGPPSQLVNQEFRSWQAPGDRHLYLFYWDPFSPRDLGPMHAVAEWPITVAGQATKLLETDLFMGYGQKVYVTHLEFKQPAARALVYAKGVSRAEFIKLLAGLEQRDR